MKVLGIRFSSVSPEAADLARFFDALGLARRPMGGDAPPGGAAFEGAVFPAGDSWIEMWPAGPQMPAHTMLQLLVDDADAFAAHARERGLDPKGPTDAHGERIYFIQAPTGLRLSFQSALPAQARQG
jgi:hypothetical protein